MKLLITGASSYVGARIYFDLKDLYQVQGTYYSNKLSDSFVQLDLTNQDQVASVVSRFEPDVIIHVANFPNSKYEDIKTYTDLNLDATLSLVDAANSVGAKCVFISGVAALYEYDIYCQLKAASEIEVKKTEKGYLILRPSLVLGVSPNQTNDRTFNRWLKALESNQQQLEQDNVWTFYPTYIGHLSQIIDQTIKKSLWNQELEVVIESVQSEYSIARDVLEGFDIDVIPIKKRSALKDVQLNLDKLNDFALEPTSYVTFIETLKSEIRDKKKFSI